MRFALTWFLTIPLALGRSRASGAALSDQFFLTVVPEDGSNSYPVTIAEVSRAALILSSALEYKAQFTFNKTSGRIFAAGSNKTGNGPITEGNVVLFNYYTTLEGSAMKQVTVDGDTYLVKEGASSEDIYVWWSKPTETGLPVQIEYQGASAMDANAALRVDTQAP
ncbi:hypothetical protein DHEL01_v211334 [Diaporthe helianthi]|uniref:Uncharacterized protein n=1 Tax=Diaporthe helianthi TaxID=158607 RepID=A0A2P5HJ46_DIAHE|nr:hypothetical protein DHEL01_v211334 [Diaporthe helianthi]